MKSIAIVTLNGYFNYGNRLQNYALQATLQSFGYKVQTIRFSRESKINRYKSYLRDIKKGISHPTNYLVERQRHKVFKKFSLECIIETERVFNKDDDLTQLNKDFDYFVVGSDQVWNPSMNKLSSFFFLNFANESKRIAYAPSFGVSELPKNVESNYKEWISEIPFLSVREDDGVKIVKNLTSREIDVLVDPTMLLTKDKWIKVASPANNKPVESYLLTYFLGEISPEYKKQIINIAELKGLKIINLGDINEIDTYCTGPREFIDYINDCSIFCTDSFHGVVFSILLEKPFVVYKREGGVSMYSRIDTLLNKFMFCSRKAENIQINTSLFKMNFSHTIPILELERKRSYEFLINALEIKGVE